MRRPVSLPLYALVVVTLLLSSIGSAATVAQPDECPEGQVELPDQNICVPEEEAPGNDGDGGAGQPEEPAGNLASLTIYHLACDNDFEAAAVRDAGGFGPANGCLTFGKPPFSYTVAADGVPIATATLDATERDFALLEVPPPAPTGTLTISIAPVADYTTELISCLLSIGDGFADIVEPPIAGGSATITTAPEQDVECWVYNVTRVIEEEDGVISIEDDGETVVDIDGQGVFADPPEGTGANITIAAHSCPAGTTVTDDLIATCNQRANGLTFSLLTATDTVATQTSDAEGDIFFADVPANDYGIAGILPSGFGEPIVICYQANANGEVLEGQRDIVFGNQFRVRLGAGDSVECAWYNVPALGPDNGPNIFIQTRSCGEGTAITSAMNVFDAEQICPVVYQGLEITVLLNEQVIATDRASDDQFSLGQVFFTRLPAPDGGGAYGITAALDEEEQTLAVFCDQDFGGGDGVFQIVPAPVTGGNRIDQVLYEGHTLRCSWFIEGTFLVGTQVADEPQALDPTSVAATEAAQQQLEPASGDEAPPVPGITVLARLCPPEVVQQRVELVVVCTEPGEGITFDVAIDGEQSSSQTTGESGELDFAVDEEPATYLIKNQPKPGHSEPEVACNIKHADGFTGQDLGSVPADSAGYEIVFDGASEVVCTFYFLIDPDALEVEDPALGVAAPAEDQAADAESEEEGNAVAAPHTLTIQFWTCPDDIDPASDEDALLQACTADPGERSFILTIDGLTTGETFTGAGTWEFNDASVFADIGAGRTSSAWCSTTWVEENEDAAEVPDTVLLNGGLLTVMVSHPVTTVTCDWFLFPG